MNELENKDVGHIYNELAKKYSTKKHESMINILICGQLLNSAKKSLPHGMFQNFLSDPRVSESERTAQRLMTIYRNFGHILEDPETKILALERLGMTRLLELQKLPKRFRKEVELEYTVEGQTYKEKQEVIDEDKLTAFLDGNIEHNGKMTPLRDLPLDELKVQINRASGIYEPTYEERQKEIADNTDKKTVDVVSSGLPDLTKRVNSFGDLPTDDSEDFNETDTTPETLVESDIIRLRKKLSDLTLMFNELKTMYEDIRSHSGFVHLSPSLKNELISDLANVKSRTEAYLLQTMDMGDSLS